MNENFIVEVKSQENHTWQGSIFWIKEQKKEYFRSALEMLRLMDSALTEDAAD